MSSDETSFALFRKLGYQSTTISVIMLKLFTIFFSFVYVFSAMAQESNAGTDTIARSNVIVKSCYGNTYQNNSNNFKNHSHNGLFKWKNSLSGIENQYFTNDKPSIYLLGNSKIDSNDLINSNVVVTDGTLNLNGKVMGSLAAINSSVNISKNSIIEGNVILFNSKVKADSSFNSGKIVCGEYFDTDEHNYVGFYNSFYPAKYNADFGGGGIVRYNRVEGLYLGLESAKKYHWNTMRNYSYSGSFGYAFGNHRWTGGIGYDRWIGNDNRIGFGAEAHSITDSKDNWRIDNTENSLAAFFIHEDYKDYYLREGWSLHASKYFNRSTTIDVKYIQDNYRSQDQNTDWSLFGGDKRFRLNPPVTEGILKSVILGFYHVTADRNDYLPYGWDIALNYENASGIASFNRILFDIRRYQLLGNEHHLSGRFIAGTADAHLPWQKSFEVGGLGTVPAVMFKSLSGNRMLLLNVEYSLPVYEFFSNFFDWDDYHNTNVGNFIISYDAGYAGNSDSQNMFNGFDINQKATRQDIGLAFGFDRNQVRIGAAFRLDKSEPAQFIFRISRPF